VNRGVLLETGSGMAYAFTKLNAIKPPMVVEATKAREPRRSSSPRTAAPASAPSITRPRAISRSNRVTVKAAAASGARRARRTRRSEWSPRSASR
jgi:hypothetical protein